MLRAESVALVCASQNNCVDIILLLTHCSYDYYLEVVVPEVVTVDFFVVRCRRIREEPFASTV